MDRLELHKLLCDILGSDNVYYQPPESTQLKFPCIIYSRAKIDAKFADNKRYLNKTRYTVTLMDSDPDSPTVYKILDSLPMCSHDRHFCADYMNQDVYDVYV